MNTVEQVMRKKVIVCKRNKTILGAAKLMKENNVGCVIVVDGNEAAGIVTGTDILEKAVAEGKDLKKTKVDEIWTRELIVTTPDTDIKNAAELMSNNDIKKLPVIDKKGALIGVIAASDIISKSPDFAEILIDLDLPKDNKIIGS